MKYGKQPNGIWVAWHFPDISPVTRKLISILAPISVSEQTMESLKTFLLQSGFTRHENFYVSDEFIVEQYEFKATGQPGLSVKLNHCSDTQKWIEGTTRQKEFMNALHEFAKHMPLACY